MVSFGCFGIPGCITFAITADLGPRRAGRQRAGGGKEKYSPSLLVGHPWVGRFAQLEGPTAYLGHDFSAVSYVNLTSGRWLSTPPCPHRLTRPPGWWGSKVGQ